MPPGAPVGVHRMEEQLQLVEHNDLHAMWYPFAAQALMAIHPLPHRLRYLAALYPHRPEREYG